MMIWQNENYRIYKLRCIRCGCYVIQHGIKYVLVDTSMKIERKILLDSLKKNGIPKLDAIILTHYHSDHVGNAAFLSRKFHCNVYASPVYIKELKSGRSSMPKGNNWLGKLVYQIVMHTSLKHMRFEKIDSVQDIQKFMELGLLGEDVKLLSTTGHSLDGIAMMIDHKVAIVGDAFIRYPFLRRVSLPWADNPDAIYDMWDTLSKERCELYLQGHGALVTYDMIEKSKGVYRR